MLLLAYLGSQDISCDRREADAAETTGQSNELEQHSSRQAPLTEDQEKLSSHSPVFTTRHKNDKDNKKWNKNKPRSDLYSIKIFFSTNVAGNFFACLLRASVQIYLSVEGLAAKAAIRKNSWECQIRIIGSFRQIYGGYRYYNSLFSNSDYLSFVWTR